MARWDNNRVSDWIEKEQGGHSCACGCSSQIAIRPEHRHDGIPRFILGHNAKGDGNPAFNGVDSWIVENQGKILCACGCGNPVKIGFWHHYRRENLKTVGFFIHGHNSRGEKNNNWKGGENMAFHLGRASNAIRVWRKKVFIRDGFRCQMPGCPNPTNKNLNAHHIVSFSSFARGRFDIDNGITLCAFCHWGIKTREKKFESIFSVIVETKRDSTK